MIMVFILVNASAAAFAADIWPKIDEIVADSYIVIDQNTGNILLEKNSHAKIYPASLTKILTAIVAIETLDLNQEITVSRNAATLSDSESAINLIADEKLTFKELLYGMLLPSGNDAAKAIAEKVGGSTAAFITMMNKKSKEIGANDSSWNNPQGLTAENHYSTSYDLSMITRYALRNDLFQKVVNTRVYSMAPTNKHPYSGWNILENSNKLLRYQDEYFASDLIYSISGVKTGTTTAAGTNLIATGHTKNGLELICVLNGVRGDNSKNVWAYTRTLFEEAAKNKQGLQTILIENNPMVPVNDQAPSTPDETFALYIGNNPEVNVAVSKENDEFIVKSTADNRVIFTTTINHHSNTSDVKSNDSSSNSIGASQGNPGTLDNSKNNQYTLYIIIILGIIVLLGICFLFIIIRKPKKSKRDKYRNNRNRY